MANIKCTCGSIFPLKNNWLYEAMQDVAKAHQPFMTVICPNCGQKYYRSSPDPINLDIHPEYIIKE